MLIIGGFRLPLKDWRSGPAVIAETAKAASECSFPGHRNRWPVGCYRNLL